MADSWWDDFSNNLATDLAPLVALFGESPTKQYLSECLTAEDIVIFAVAPLGVITAIVSAIRVCGTPSLRAFIGRAQEGAGTAEAELCSSTSRDVCELYNNGGIARVFGRPKLLEIVHDPEAPDDAFYPANGSVATAGIYSFPEYTRTEKGKAEWKPQQSSLGRRQKALASTEGGIVREKRARFAPNPNLSLNIGIRPLGRSFFMTAVTLGVMMQLFVLVWACLTRYHFRWVRNSREDDYAVPLTLIGTLLLCFGMGLCAYLIESKTMEEVYERASLSNKSSQSIMYWAQPGNQVIGDQMFDPFGYSDGRLSLQRYITSWKETTGIDSNMSQIWTAVIATSIGFICQFLGLRACHSSVAIAQLGITLIMSAIRSGLRAQRLRKEDNFMADDPDLFQGHELDCLTLDIGRSHVTSIKKPQSTEIQSRRVWKMFSSPSTSINHIASSSCNLKKHNAHNFVVLEELPVPRGDRPILYGFRLGPQAIDDKSPENRSAAVERELAEWMSKNYCSGCKLTRNRTTKPCKRDPDAAARAFFYRSRLARMTGLAKAESDHSSYWGAQFVTVRETAHILAQSIEDTMGILFDEDSRSSVKLCKPWGEAFAIFWAAQCCLVDPLSLERQESDIYLSLRRAIDEDGMSQGSWKVDRSEMESMLGLWLWSLKESNKGQDMEEVEFEKPGGPINRIISIHQNLQDVHDERLDFDIWQQRGGIKMQDRRLIVKPAVVGYENGSESGIRDDQLDFAQVQNAVWWTENGDFVTRNPGPHASQPPIRQRRRIFGWYNLRENSRRNESDEFAVLETSSESSLLLNCAQEIYSTFLNALMRVVEDIGGDTETKRYQGNFVVENRNIGLIQSVLITSGLCDPHDAFACTIPILRNHDRLPFPDDVISIASDMVNEYRREKKWKEFRRLLGWLLHGSYGRVESGRNQQGSAEEMEAVNHLRLSLLEACETYHQALQQDDEEQKIFGSEGILDLVRRYSQDRKIVNIPFVWVDSGTVPANASALVRPFSLADAIRCYGESAFWCIRTKPGPLSIREQQVQAELGGYFKSRDAASNFLGAVADLDLSSALYLLQQNPPKEPVRTQALIRASQIGFYTVAKVLVEAGAAVDKEDNNERPALTYASELGDINIVRMLISKGASMRNRGKRDYSHRLTAGHYAAKQGHAVIVDALLQRYNSDMDETDDQGLTPLSWAITSGNSATVRVLLSYDRTVRANYYHTIKPALHWAIHEDKGHMVDVLLEIAAVDPNHNDGRTISSPALVCTVRLRNESMFEKILNSERVDPDCTDSEGRTALWWAAALGLDSYVQKLIKCERMHLLDKTDNGGLTPLSIAVQAGHGKVARQLQVLEGTSVDIKSIIIATTNGYKVLVEDIMNNLKSKRLEKQLLEAFGLDEEWLNMQNGRPWERICEMAEKMDTDSLRKLGHEYDLDLEYASKLASTPFEMIRPEVS